MGVRIDGVSDDRKPVIRLNRLNKAMGYIIAVLRGLFAVVAAASFVAALFCLMQGDTSNASSVIFGQWMVGSLVYLVILTQLDRLFKDMRADSPSFFTRQIPRLRIIGASFLCLTALGVIFSLAAVLLANGHQPLFNVGLGFPGFPRPDMWYAVFDQNYVLSVPSVVSIDISSLVAAGLVWSLSYVFEYGAWLQHERDTTI